MSTLEINKIIASILTAGMVAMLSGFVAHVLYERKPLEQKAYKVLAAEAPATAAASKPAAPKVAPIAVRLASADPSAGQALAKKCAACHSLDKGGPNKIGPHLWGVVNRPIASIGDFSYSGALSGKSGGTWTFENLDHFLTKPKDWVPGTKMSFAGLAKPDQRADVIAYLNTLSDSPAPLPTPAPEAAAKGTAQTGTAEKAAAAASTAAKSAAGAAATAATQTAEAAAGNLASQIAAADPEAGMKIAHICKTCHSLDKGGPNKIGPHLWGVVGRPIASAEGFSYSSALSKKSGETWTFENLNHFLTKPKDWVPGTKMGFAGLAKPEDRVKVLAYLHTLSDNPVPLPK